MSKVKIANEFKLKDLIERIKDPKNTSPLLFDQKNKPLPIKIEIEFLKELVDKISKSQKMN